MNFHRVSHLNHQGVRINELVIHSYEMGVYLAEAEYDGRKAFLQDETGRAQRFHSVEEVRQLLDRCTICKAYLVHQSAYDEMCGCAEHGDNTLKVPLFVTGVS